MSSHQRLSRTSMRVFVSLNGLVLAGLAAWILMPSATAPAPEDRILQEPPTEAPERWLPGEADPDGPPSKEDILGIEGVRFGISSPEVPWSESEFQWLTDVAGAPPTMVQFFVNWDVGYPAETVELTYQRGALPVISWEPWGGLEQGINQPDYSLAKIIDGEFDEYLEEFAESVRDHAWPVAIRLAHEMNGTWYPWSEQNSGNQPGEFAEAWRHVHDVFTDAGAGNVIWLWSPNIIRPVPEVSLEALYPGDDYVDWVGLVGYAVTETTAEAVFGPSQEVLREFTDRPLVLTETGAQPGPNKTAWIEDFFEWLGDNEDVAGFIWFEYDIPDGGNADWRFTATPETIEAFRSGISGTDLAVPPVE